LDSDWADLGRTIRNIALLHGVEGISMEMADCLYDPDSLLPL